MPSTPKSNLTVVQGTRTPSGMSFDLFGDIAEQEARAAQAAIHPVGVGVSQPVGLPVALVPPQGLVELPPGLSPVMQPPPQRSHVTPLNHPVQPITNPPGTQASFQEWIRGELQGMVAAQVEVLAQRMQQAGMIPPQPIACPPAAPQAKAQGAASGAPVAQPTAGGTQGAAPCAPVPNITLGGGYVTPTNQNVPLSFQLQGSQQPVSGSSESSSESGDDVRSPKLPIPSRHQCRICGDYHEEVSCPQLTMNAQPASTTTATVCDYAQDEEDTIRVKSLNDLVFPNPPENAAQARGYVNQVLMAIGKLQKTRGHEVYQWAQECMTSEDATLRADPRFPRTDREIASKLLKTCKKGRFGLIFNKWLSPKGPIQVVCHVVELCFGISLSTFSWKGIALACWGNEIFFP